MGFRRATQPDRPIIENLLELYLYDMAELYGFPVGTDGLYAYDRLDAFWQHPYLITSGDDIAGLALVIDHCPLTGRAPCWFMAEFFIMRPYRRTGLGAATATGMIAAHPGDWHIGVIEKNAAAMAFWARTLDQHAPTSSAIEHDGAAWRLHSFRV